MNERIEPREAVVRAAREVDGRKVLSCSEAFELAEKLSLSRQAIGVLCNETGVRIVACQLGCFK